MKDEKIPRTRSPERIIDLLMKNTHDMIKKNEKMTFSRIQQEIGLSRPVLSQHLRKLQEDEVIEFERHGREKHYRLAKKITKNFESQVELFSTRYTTYKFMSNSSLEPKNKETIFQEISNNLSAVLIFSLLLSIKTGKNWLKTFDTDEMFISSADLLCHILFGKNVSPEELQFELGEGWDNFIKKTHKLTNNKKNEPKIDDLLKYLKTGVPVEYEMLKKFLMEVKPDITLKN